MNVTSIDPHIQKDVDYVSTKEGSPLSAEIVSLAFARRGEGSSDYWRVREAGVSSILMMESARFGHYLLDKGYRRLMLNREVWVK